MANCTIIKNLDQLLQQGLNRKVTVKECTTSRLTAAGENYGSLMLGVEVRLHESNGLEKEETLKLVAKMCPPNEWLKKMFNITVTFRREIFMYNTIIPMLQAFQKEQGVSNVIACFPECYGTRISLDPKSDVVDDDAVLLLENLKWKKYEVVDRMQGFDLQTAELIIQDLARFHAVPIALKLLKPDAFYKKILPHLKTTPLFKDVSESVEKSVIDLILETAKLNDECVPLLPDIERKLIRCLKNLRNPSAPREPFATITHNDFWVNNTMIKFTEGQPTKNKMVDFQLIDYGSPGKDIIFFLFTSVQKQVLDLHYDNLIKLYYNTFVKTLHELKCDPAPFTFDMLQEEIDISANTQEFFHIMIMLRPIYAKKGKVRELSEMTEEDLIQQDITSEEYKQKVPEILLRFANKKWLL